MGREKEGEGDEGRERWEGKRCEVRSAVGKNVAVAARERGERRARPQSMWPEVQPEPSCGLLIYQFPDPYERDRWFPPLFPRRPTSQR